METTKQPYELLIRWDQDGKLAGAQIQYRYVIRDGGTIIGDSVSNAEPILPDSSGKFPLADVMDAAEVAAIAASNIAQAEIARLNNVVVVKDAEIEAITAEVRQVTEAYEAAKRSIEFGSPAASPQTGT